MAELNDRRPPSKGKLLGFRLTQQGWAGTLCAGCKKQSEKQGQEFGVVQELRGAGDVHTIEVCEDCGKTVQGRVKNMQDF